jgi:hypothetical protein
MVRDLETLTAEATAPEPRPSRIRGLLDDLKESAAALGVVATPVVDLAVKLSQLFHF